MKELKEKIEGRYDQVKKSFIREYKLKPNKKLRNSSSADH